MVKFSLQHKNVWIRFISCIVMPAVAIGFLLLAGIDEFNYTMVLNDSRYRTAGYAAAIPVMLWFFYGIYRKAIKVLPKKQLVRKLLLCMSMVIVTIVTPYAEDGSFLSNLHVYMAYASFVFYNLILFQSFQFSTLYRRFFVPALMAAGMVVLLDGRISGPAEAIFACAVFILLGW